MKRRYFGDSVLHAVPLFKYPLAETVPDSMGNRAVITDRAGRFGIYLHWNGGRDSVRAFLLYAEMRGFRRPEEDNYGWARLCQVVCNFFGGSLSVGIGPLSELDCDNGDNGVYVIEGWRIVGRDYFDGEEQDGIDLAGMVAEIDRRQPEADRLGEEAVRQWMDDFSPDWRICSMFTDYVGFWHMRNDGWE